MPESRKKNISIKIYGDFKDSGIRFSAMHEAYKAGVTGLARYTEDSAVYLEAEGKAGQIERFKAWCMQIAQKQGKSKTEIGYHKLRGYNEFKILD